MNTEIINTETNIVKPFENLSFLDWCESNPDKVIAAVRKSYLADTSRADSRINTHLLDLIARFNSPVINDNVLDVTWLNKLCEGEGVTLPKTRSLSHALSGMGYRQIEGRRIKVAKSPSKHYIWIKGDEEGLVQKVRSFHRGEYDQR